MSDKNIPSSLIPIDDMPSNIVIYRYSNDDFIFIDFNKIAEKTDNIRKEELIGKRLTEMFPGVKKLGLFDLLLSVHKKGGHEECDLGFYEDDRISGWRHNYVSILPNGDVIVSYTDMTKEKHLEEEIKKQAQILEQINDSIISTDLEGNILNWNKGSEKMLGYSADEVIGQHMSIIHRQEDMETIEGYVSDLLDTGLLNVESYLVKKSKELVFVSVSLSLLKDERGNIIGMIGISQDITQRKKIEEELVKQKNILEYQAYHDALTKLPNRALFFDRLEKTLAISKRKEHAFALLYIDLDAFKRINDTYGHDTGDLLLIEVSKKIQSCIREADTVARIGGDEFVILLAEIASNDEPGIMANRIIDLITQSFHISGHTCNIGASIGISLYPEHSSNRDELLTLADKAMYEVKYSGKNNCRYAK